MTKSESFPWKARWEGGGVRILNTKGRSVMLLAGEEATHLFNALSNLEPTVDVEDVYGQEETRSDA